MKKAFFSVVHRSEKSKARVGIIQTAHGTIKTPAFVAVGTKGTVKALTPGLLSEIKTQAAFVNTYHLVTHPGADIIQKAGGIHAFSKLNMPLMSDSGGFQVFSLANQKTPLRPTDFEGQAKQKQRREAKIYQSEEIALILKISDDGVKFRSTYDGAVVEFTPEKSMEYQIKIGADIMMAFDECTYYPATHEYTEKAMVRTHNWLIRCIQYKARCQNFLSPSGSPPRRNVGESQVAKNLTPSLLNTYHYDQYLYGVIQGGTYEDLRKKSAKFVVGQDTNGVAIGGIAIGESKKEIRDQVKWVSDYLPSDRPVHLLGVGQFDDIIDLMKYGIDTFDCVEPTRLGRMGRIYLRKRIFSQEINSHPDKMSGPFIPPSTSESEGSVGTHLLKQLTPSKKLFPSDQLINKDFYLDPTIDLFKSVYKTDLSPVDEDCDCYTCVNFTKAYLHHLFKQKEMLGPILATYHNLYVMEKFFSFIRKAIEENKL